VILWAINLTSLCGGPQTGIQDEENDASNNGLCSGSKWLYDSGGFEGHASGIQSSF